MTSIGALLLKLDAGEYWPSEEAIKRISQHTPVLFLTGRLDDLVPPSHMDVLMTNCTSNTKIRMVLSRGNHNDTCVQVSPFDISI